VAIAAAKSSGAEVRRDFAETPTRHEPAGFGVFVSEKYVLTHALALGGRTSAPISTADGQTIDSWVAGYDPSNELVLLEVATAGGRAAPFAAARAAAGTLAVGVAHWHGHDITVPLFVIRAENDRYGVGALNDAISAGMPIYDLDGALLALGAGAEASAVSVREAAAALIERAVAGEQRPSIGLTFQELTARLSRRFGDRGVVTTDVVTDGPADVAGIRAGDVLLAVGDVEVDTVDTAARALSSVGIGVTIPLRVRRNGRDRIVEVAPAALYHVAALARTRVDDGAAAVEARELLPSAALVAAEIPNTARVVAINGRPVSTPAQASRELRIARGSVLLLLQHDGRRFFAAIESVP
jgi:S1-C subfamily serine protease